MKKIYLIIFLITISNCTLNPVEKHHGLHHLDKKFQKVTVNQTNKNDILKIFGPPSTTSNFENDLWIYIERKQKTKSVLKLAANKLYVNNVVILEIDNKGMLIKKNFFDVNDMNQLKFSEEGTRSVYKKDDFIYNFLSSLRQKINDPLGKRDKAGTTRRD